MTRQNEQQSQNADHLMEGKFEDFAKSLLISEIRTMMRRLQETGEFQVPAVRFEELGLRELKYLKRELRDTLRSLGGGR